MQRPFESLEPRSYLAVNASFNAATGVLTIIGDGKDNDIVISRDASGGIDVDATTEKKNGKKSKKEKINPTAATVANTTLIQVFTDGGDDSVALDEASGLLPRALIDLGTGNDTGIGGSGGDIILGGAGNDDLLGKGGVDALFGGEGNDNLTGGDGDDQSFGEAGNDRMIWNPGDDSDLNEGGDGSDTVEVNGGNGAEIFTATASGARVRFDRLNPAPFFLDIGAAETLVLNANGGDDSFSATGNLAALIQLTIDGGAGKDSINGSNGADLLLGGDDDDFIDGQQGTDIALLGAGDDVFQWDPGDGSDVVEGQAGDDTLLFNGSGAAEIFEAANNGGRLRFTRNVGNIVMDVDDVESIDLNTLGGSDTARVSDLTGTDVVDVAINLAGTLGGSAGDAQPDTVIVDGTSGDDNVEVFGSGNSYAVVGLVALVSVSSTDPFTDALAVQTKGGDDTFNASTLVAGIANLTVDAGAGEDSVFGSRGDDLILGGDDDDFIDGQQGNDVAFMGAGDDVFQWDPGDGSDTIEGQVDVDTMLFNGSGAAESFDISANGGRVLFFRNVGNITMDLDDLENITLNALGGADNIVVGDLSGTDMARVDLHLAGGSGGGDGQADNVVVNGTQGDDVIVVSNNASGVHVTGTAAQVNISDFEPANDKLTINALAGADVVDATGLQANVVGFLINGGLGADVLLGSQGDDLVNGGDGDDTALLGAGNDTFVWNPGDDNDAIEGQAGADTMLFNGANVAENIDISANGGRVLFFRNIANVTMDLNDVELIDFNALGGADTIVVNDLTGTDVTSVNLNLAAAGGAGDTQPDSVIVSGTNGNDIITVAGNASGVAVTGLAAAVNITGHEQIDRLTINALGGGDIVQGSGLLAGAIPFTADGGAGADLLIGGDNVDTLLGGDDDDTLIGNGGVDILDGGGGINILVQ